MPICNWLSENVLSPHSLRALRNGITFDISAELGRRTFGIVPASTTSTHQKLLAVKLNSRDSQPDYLKSEWWGQNNYALKVGEREFFTDIVFAIFVSNARWVENEVDPLI